MQDISPRLGVIITIALGGAAIAGWRLGVAPMHSQLAAAQAQSASISAQIRQLEAFKLPDQAIVDQDLIRLQQQQDRLTAAATVPDGNRIQEQIRSLAAVNGVRVDRLERRSRTAAHDPKQTSYSLRDTFGYTMTVSGPYSGVADFLQAIRSDINLSKVASLKLTPAQPGEKPGVNAIIETAHMRLIVPQSQAADKKKQKPSQKDATK
ncbi:MAG: hypothetical protein IT435_10690 [Phycisphaerales bacterium]|nr:hypothetical protein [Phycisphaerales bacterium]